MKFVMVAIAALSLLVACGEDPETDDNEPQQNEQQNDEPDGPEWADFHRESGWMELDDQLGDDDQVVDDALGLWIEAMDAELPESCDGTLTAAGDSDGLAVAREAADGGETAPTPVPDRVDPRPDLTGEPSPIFRTSFRGRVRDYDENPDYDRLVEIEESMESGAVYILSCATMYFRGGCYMPNDEFLGVGCSTSPDSRTSSLDSTSGLDQDDDDRVMTHRESAACDEDEKTDTHPEDLDVGHHRLVLHDFESLDDDGVIDLEPDDFTWEASTIVEEDCETREDTGPTCECTWDVQEVTGLHRASALIGEDDVYLDLASTTEADGFLLWGRFELK